MRSALLLLFVALAGVGSWAVMTGQIDLGSAPELALGGDADTVYQYVDERGSVRFVDTLDEVPLALRGTAGRVKMDRPARAAGGSGASARASHAATAADVVVVTTPGCHYCEKTMEWLSARSIPFREVDIHSGDPAVERIGRKRGQVVAPTVEFGDTIIFGYDADRLAHAFGRG